MYYIYTKKTFLIIFFLLPFISKGQYTTVFSDSLKNKNTFKDYSLLTKWGNYDTIRSAFKIAKKTDNNKLSFNAISLTDSALAYAGSYTTKNSLKTSNCFDYKFKPIKRNTDTIIVEFDAIWDTLSHIGEQGRIVVTLVHGYPSYKTKFGYLDSTHLEKPFGKPAYNFRLLNKEESDYKKGAIYMMYGGGEEKEGEFEIYDPWHNDKSWWLPGFSTAAGGGSPGSDENYPEGPTRQSTIESASDSIWHHYTWEIYPEMMILKVRKSNEPASNNDIRLKMAIPKLDNGKDNAIKYINQIHNTNISNLPHLYNWFPEINGLRFYFRGIDNVNITNVQLRTTYTNTTNTVRYNEKENNFNLSLYPNPVRNRLNFNLPGEDKCHIQLLNANGSVIRHFYTASGKKSINVTSLKKGIYLLNITNNKHQQTYKFIKH